MPETAARNRKRFWLVVLATCIAVGGIATTSWGPALLVLIVGIFSVQRASRMLRLPRRVGTLAIAYSIIACVIGATLWLNSPGVDALAYVKAGEGLAANGLASDNGVSRTVLVPGKQGYAYLLGGLFLVLGTSGLAAVALNASLLGLTIVLTSATVQLIDERAVKYAPLLFASFPGLLLWAATPLREASVLSLTSLLLYSSIRLQTQRVAATSVIVGLFAMTALALFRGPTAIALGPALLILGAATRRGRGRTFNLILLGGGLALAAALVLPSISGILTRFDTERISVSQSELAGASSGFVVGGEGGIGTLYSLGRVMLGPYPWEAAAAGIGLASAPIWCYAVFLSGVAVHRYRMRTLVALAGIAILGVALAISSGNYGTLLRVRLQIVPFLVVAGSLGASAISKRRFRRRELAKGGLN